MKNLNLISAAIVSLLLFSCNSKDGSFTSEKEVYSVKETKGLINSNVLLIDVRDANEIQELSYDVQGVKNIPLARLESKLGSIPKDKQVILVCRTGKRSAQAFEILKTKGYTNVATMKGGILAWKKAGYPVKASESACCADPTSENCNPDGTCKVPEKKEACCADPTSENCNPDGTCKTDTKK